MPQDFGHTRALPCNMGCTRVEGCGYEDSKHAKEGLEIQKLGPHSSISQWASCTPMRAF